jgi:signal transduction histidine kinase
MIADTNESLDFLSGHGEMTERIRNFNWENTALGSPEKWSSGLRNTVALMLSNRFPMLLWWGEDYISIYNDAYIPVLGSKHPWGLGKPVKECWSEIWHVLQPLIDTPFYGGPSTWMEDITLIINRNNFSEETHFTIAYSPVPDSNASNGIGGVLATVNEITQQVISQRALDTVRNISAYSLGAKKEDEVYEKTAIAFEENNKDFPLVLIYKVAEDGDTASLIAAAGVEKSHDLIRDFSRIDLRVTTLNTQHIVKAFSENRIVHSVNNGSWQNVPQGAWDVMPEQFVHVPVKVSTRKNPSAIITMGLNPYRRFDDNYRNFIQLVSEQITQSVSNAIAFEEQRKHAETTEQLNRAKTLFFTNISHEFRTPITLMAGTVEEIINDPDTLPKNVERLSVANRNAIRLLKLVNTLLDFSRIESGRIESSFVPTDITGYTEDLASNFRSIIEKAGLKFTIHGDVNAQPVYLDRQLYEKIVFNLLSNAFKYTFHGEIAVTITYTTTHALLKVKDTGVGIPEKELPFIFNRFYRVSNATGRTYEGTGIGLALTKELVLLHGGTITVESEEAQGSVFSVALPFGNEHLPASQVKETADDDESMIGNAFINEALSLLDTPSFTSNDKTRQKSEDVILIVEDNADMRRHIQSILEKKYSVITAVNGRDALHKIDEYKPALVLSDIMMPEMDGIELLKRVRQNTSTTNIPVILISARAGEEAKIEGYEKGADDYLIKPFSAKELLARVQAQLVIKKKRDDALQSVYRVFDDVPFAVAVLKGNDLTIDFINKYNLEIWQQKKEDVLNRPLFDVRPDIRASAQPIHNEIFHTGKRFSGNEVPIEIKRNGNIELRYFDVVIDPLLNEEGKIIGQLATSMDVTEKVFARKIMEGRETELREMNSLLEEKVTERTSDLIKANKELESFNYISSHDLQEPLRKIQTFINLIRDDRSGEKHEIYFDKIDGAAKRMAYLIQSILEYSKISQAKELFAEVELNKILAGVITDLELVIQEKGACIESNDLPVINANGLQMHQLFSNLINNSLKFSTGKPIIKIEGEITTGAQITPGALVSAEQEFVHLTFTDNGIGFDPVHKDQIFSLFQRLHGKHEFAGSGIGLSIVKKIVDNHNGYISASGKPGTGATFEIWLPR